MEGLPRWVIIPMPEPPPRQHKHIRSSCEETFEKCQWNNLDFDCCTYFSSLRTEFGLCYSINNIQTKEHNFINLATNWTTGSGTILLQLKIPANVYLHSSADMPNLNVAETDQMEISTVPGERHEIYFAIHDTENSVGVESVNYRKRKCKFPWETQGFYYPHYSYSTCLVECRMQAILELCNCTSHLMSSVYNTPSESTARVCTTEDLYCITRNSEFLTNLQPAWNPGKEALKCRCFSGCEEIQIDEIINRKSRALDESKSYIELKQFNVPSEIFRRTVVRSKLDLVVSMGSAVSLFVGASLLSFVELIYYFTLRLRLQRKRPAKLGLRQRRRNKRTILHYGPCPKDRLTSLNERNILCNHSLNGPPVQPFMN